jgi:hypothetical protein
LHCSLHALAGELSRPGCGSRVGVPKTKAARLIYFKQVFGNQEALEKQLQGQSNLLLYPKALELVSKGNLTLPLGGGSELSRVSKDSEALAKAVTAASESSPFRSCLIELAFLTPGPTHVVAVVEDYIEYISRTWYVFDPSCGLFICDATLSEQTLSELFEEMWQRHRMMGEPFDRGQCFPVARKT